MKLTTTSAGTFKKGRTHITDPLGETSVEKIFREYHEMFGDRYILAGDVGSNNFTNISKPSNVLCQNGHIFSKSALAFKKSIENKTILPTSSGCPECFNAGRAKEIEKFLNRFPYNSLEVTHFEKIRYGKGKNSLYKDRVTFRCTKEGCMEDSVVTENVSRVLGCPCSVPSIMDVAHIAYEEMYGSTHLYFSDPKIDIKFSRAKEKYSILPSDFKASVTSTCRNRTHPATKKNKSIPKTLRANLHLFLKGDAACTHCEQKNLIDQEMSIIKEKFMDMVDPNSVGIYNGKKSFSSTVKGIPSERVYRMKCLTHSSTNILIRWSGLSSLPLNPCQKCREIERKNGTKLEAMSYLEDVLSKRVSSPSILPETLDWGGFTSRERGALTGTCSVCNEEKEFTFTQYVNRQGDCECLKGTDSQQENLCFLSLDYLETIKKPFRVSKSDRVVLAEFSPNTPKELDRYIKRGSSTKGIGLEFNGHLWHSMEQVNRKGTFEKNGKSELLKYQIARKSKGLNGVLNVWDTEFSSYKNVRGTDLTISAYLESVFSVDIYGNEVKPSSSYIEDFYTVSGLTYEDYLKHGCRSSENFENFRDPNDYYRFIGVKSRNLRDHHGKEYLSVIPISRFMDNSKFTIMEPLDVTPRILATLWRDDIISKGQGYKVVSLNDRSVVSAFREFLKTRTTKVKANKTISNVKDSGASSKLGEGNPNRIYLYKYNRNGLRMVDKYTFYGSGITEFTFNREMGNRQKDSIPGL